MMMKKTLFMAAIAALALSSCSKDTPAAGTSAETGTAISFRTTINKTDFADTNDAPETKVAHANLQLNNFTLFARKWSTPAPLGTGSTTVKGEGFDFMNFFTVARQQNTGLPANGDLWVYYPLKHFPSSPSTEGISFFAYSPAGSRLVSGADATQPHLVNSGTGSQMQFDYTVPMIFTEQGANQEDFLVASYKQSSTAAAVTPATTAAVKLNFVHALSSISFAAQNSSNNTGFVAHKIELINFDNRGTLTISAPTTEAASSTLSNIGWANNTPQVGNIYTFNMLGYNEIDPTNLSGAYIAPKSNNVEQISELTSGNEYMMMLPQNFSNFLDPIPPYNATTAPGGTKPLGVDVPPTALELSTYCYIKITFSSFEGDMNWIYKRAELYLRMPNPEWAGPYAVYPNTFEKGKMYKFTYRFDGNAAGSPITIGGITVSPWTPDGLTVFPNP